MEPGEGAKGVRRPPRVLVIDDSPTQRRAILQELSELNVETQEAVDGFDGLRKVASWQPDLVTLDIHMPMLTGDKVLQTLKSKEHTMTLPVIMISGRPSERERLRALERGAIEYFHKPFPEGALRLLVSQVLEQLAHNRETSVFCLDSDPEIRSLLEQLLGTHGYQCRTFGEAEQFLSALTEQHCDILLLDLHLARHAAFGVLEQLRDHADFASMAKIGLTTRGARKDVGNAFRFGIDDFVRKPFFAEELVARIEHQSRLKLERSHLERIATIDPLTGLNNRREVTRCLEVEVARARRDERDFGVLMLDIDHFKNLNDTFGHPFGDKVLRGVGAALREEVRMTDVVGRYGGEEFIILLPGAQDEAMAGLAERVRERIEALDFKFENKLVKVTVSVGGCLWSCERLKAEPQLEAFVKPADRALYRAKDMGRNRCVVESRATTRSTMPTSRVHELTLSSVASRR